MNEIIGNGSGGIPGSIFRLDPDNQVRKGVVDGISGLTILSYEVAPDKVNIFDRRSPFFHFNALRFPLMATFSIRTKGYLGISKFRHPDLFAGQLLRASVEHFDRYHRLQSVIGNWFRNADNADIFCDYLKARTINKPSFDDYRKAAQATWTGQQVFQLGFTEVFTVDVINDEIGQLLQIVTVFRRPQ